MNAISQDLWKPWDDDKPYIHVVSSLPDEKIECFVCNHTETGQLTAIARNQDSARKLAALLRSTAISLERIAETEPTLKKEDDSADDTTE